MFVERGHRFERIEIILRAPSPGGEGELKHYFSNPFHPMIVLRKKRIPTTALGLALHGSRMEGVLVRRANGSMQVLKSFSATLVLNPLTGDTDLVGREIRNHLEQAGIRERRCVVSLQSSWALTLATEVPDMPEEDIPGFLEIEAERGFPYGLEALSVGRSMFRATSGKRFATQVAVPHNHLEQLERALKAAQLRPTSITLGVTALQSPEKESSNGVLALVLGDGSVDLQITCASGVAVLRSLDSVFESESVQNRLSTDLLLREIKITLGQLPGDFRDAVRRVRVFGRGEAARRFINEAAPRLEERRSRDEDRTRGGARRSVASRRQGPTAPRRGRTRTRPGCRQTCCVGARLRRGSPCASWAVTWDGAGGSP